MHRDYLIKLLEKYQPLNEQEAHFKITMLDFVNDNTNCFDRTNTEGHITASAWLLNNDMRQVLLLHHAKLDVWCQLGGHCDGDPNVLAVAIKEAQEESGISNIVPVSTEIFDLDIHHIPAFAKDASHYHYDVRFLLKVVGDEQIVANNESKDLRWFGKQEELLPTRAESVLRMFRKWSLGSSSNHKIG